MKSKDCIFCQIAQEKSSEVKIKESANFFAIRDKFPTSQGHTLVIPKKHFVTILDIPNTLGPELLKMIKEVGSELLDKKFGDGFNIVQNNLEVAGQVVMHAHFHVIPRKENDGLRFVYNINKKK